MFFLGLQQQDLCAAYFGVWFVEKGFDGIFELTLLNQTVCVPKIGATIVEIVMNHNLRG